METVGLVIAGLLAGWVARSSVDGSRDLAVRAIAKGHELADRSKRFVAIEREHIEDLLAEGRARYETERAGRRWQGAVATSERRGPAATAAQVSQTRDRAA